MLVDSEGNLWVATYQGLYNLFRLQFKNYWLKNRSDVVRGVVMDGSNDKIIGSYNGELIRFNDDSSANIAYHPMSTAIRLARILRGSRGVSSFPGMVRY